MISLMRKYRILKELTLDDIFLRTDICISRLSRLERGILKPTSAEKRLISKALKMSADELFDEEDKDLAYKNF